MAQENDPRHIVTRSHNVSSWWRCVDGTPLVVFCARGVQSSEKRCSDSLLRGEKLAWRAQL